MSERIEVFLKHLRDQSRKLKLVRSRQESTRKGLEDVARVAVGRYEKQSEEILPEVMLKVRTTIQPWWRELQESGVYQNILDSIGYKTWAKLEVHQPVVYNWPYRSAIKHLKEDIPFFDNVKWRNDTQRLKEVKGELTKHMSSEIWRGTFFLTSSDKFQGLGLEREPADIRDGRFVALARMEDPVSFSEDETLLKQAPKVFLGLAEQIENGQVWNVLTSELEGLKNW